MKIESLPKKVIGDIASSSIVVSLVRPNGFVMKTVCRANLWGNICGAIIW